MKNYIFLLFITVPLLGLSQKSKKIIFEESFDNNKNNWLIKNNWKRQSSINNGMLIDHNTSFGFQVINGIYTDFDEKDEHIITFRVANLNNKKGYKYPTYLEKKDGSQGRLKYIDNPSYSIIWGFKDWSNYNAIKIITINNYGLESKYKAISVVNGNEILHKDWTSSYKLEKETGFNIISIENTKSHGYFVYLNGHSDYSTPDIIIESNKWYDNFIGVAIGNGAKVALDNLKIEKEEYTVIKPSFNISIHQLNNFLENLQEGSVSKGNSYTFVNTNKDGKRTIQHVDERLDGLPNDERALSIEFLSLIFEMLFGSINYNQTQAYSADQLVNGLKKLNIDGMSYKGKNNTYYYSWEQILEYDN